MPLLQAPVTNKNLADGQIVYGGYKIAFGLGVMQGWRSYQEDAVAVDTQYLNSHGLCAFAVFDGHGGSATSHYCGKHFTRFLLNYCIKRGGVKKSLIRRAFLKFDASLPENVVYSDDKVDFTKYSHKHTGTTATVTVVDFRAGKLFIAHCGDSRCLTFHSKDGAVLHETQDHNPSESKEFRRIVYKNQIAVSDGRMSTVIAPRVIGTLNVCRGFGDKAFKNNPRVDAKHQAVTAYPDVVEMDLAQACAPTSRLTLQQQRKRNPDQVPLPELLISPEPLCVYMASDGIWNAEMSYQTFPYCRPNIRDQVVEWSRLHSLAKAEKSDPYFFSPSVAFCMDTLIQKAPLTPRYHAGTDNMSICMLAISKIRDTRTVSTLFQTNHQHTVMRNWLGHYDSVAHRPDGKVHREMELGGAGGASDSKSMSSASTSMTEDSSSTPSEGGVRATLAKTLARASTSSTSSGGDSVLRQLGALQITGSEARAYSSSTNQTHSPHSPSLGSMGSLSRRNPGHSRGRFGGSYGGESMSPAGSRNSRARNSTGISGLRGTALNKPSSNTETERMSTGASGRDVWSTPGATRDRSMSANPRVGGPGSKPRLRGDRKMPSRSRSSNCPPKMPAVNNNPQMDRLSLLSGGAGAAASPDSPMGKGGLTSLQVGMNRQDRQMADRFSLGSPTYQQTVSGPRRGKKKMERRNPMASPVMPQQKNRAGGSRRGKSAFSFGA